MSTKTLGVVGRGSVWQKVGIELGSFIFYPNSSQPGMFQTFAQRCPIYKVYRSKRGSTNVSVERAGEKALGFK